MDLYHLYEMVSTWVFDHPVETDVIVVAAVLGTCAVILRRQRRKRRRLHRFLWGTLMKRKDREQYQKMQFEDALGDAAMEMYHRGDMTEAEEKQWFIFFAERLGLFGLLPQKNVKLGVRTRLRKRFGLKPVDWPGDKPGVEHIDKTYDPNAPVIEGLSSSKYV